MNQPTNGKQLGAMAPMHRKKQDLGQGQALALLAEHVATSGTLALNDPELGAPYTVPLSYVYLPEEGELGSVYFHGSRVGRKVELMRADPRASFCVTTADVIVPETFSTDYRSVTAIGRVEFVTDEDERLRALRALGHTYAPLLPDSATEDEIAGGINHTCVFCLRVEQASAKESKALAKRRAQA